MSEFGKHRFAVANRGQLTLDLRDRYHRYVANTSLKRQRGALEFAPRLGCGLM